MGRIIFILSCLLVGMTNLNGEQASGNLTTIKSSESAPNSKELKEKIGEKIKELTSSKEKSSTESVKSNSEESKISNWMTENTGVGRYASRLSNAYSCFNSFVKDIVKVRLKAYDLTVACGLQGSAYCDEQQKVIASSQVMTDDFYTCLDGKSKTESASLN